MSNRLAPLLVLLLIAAPVSAKVKVEFDPTVDFDSYRTFAWLKTPTTSLWEDYPDIHRQIVKTMDYLLITGELTEADDEPDLYWTYHARTNSELRLDTNQLGYAYGAGWIWNPGWGGNPGAVPMTGHLRTFKQGTLVVDLIDARSNELIWRGSAEGKLPYDREVLKRKIDTMLRKMARMFQKEYRKQQKKNAKQ